MDIVFKFEEKNKENAFFENVKKLLIFGEASFFRFEFPTTRFSIKFRHFTRSSRKHITQNFY